MSCCRQTFSDTEVKTVRAAEKIGRPAAALHELAAFGEKLSAMKKKIKSALTYPSIVLIAALVALAILMAVVVPKFETIFSLHGSDAQSLPWLTKKVLNSCNFLRAHVVALAVLLLCIPLALRMCFAKKVLREKLSAIFGKIPIFGNLLLCVSLNKFFRTIGMLMSFGVPLQTALQLSIGVIGDNFHRQSFTRVLDRIKHGETLSASFGGNRLLAATDHGLILAGEESGNLAKSFAKIAELYEQKIDGQLTFLAALVEPAIIVFLSIVVGIIVISIFLPMISIMQSVRI
ncbi:MAG: type II secretion system F family protein, partial [Puniceicoccales bacterium]|jgi:type IV pilus assembly protein PilC|nr:type II secretion system F family protein [Puniceicoccales bacterium]